MEKSRAIEHWGHYRETTHRYFRLNRKTLPWVVTFGAVVPYLLYRQIRSEQVNSCQVVFCVTQEDHDNVIDCILLILLSHSISFIV